MKSCPRCGQTYTDPDINFCLNDGELLSRSANTTNQDFLASERPASSVDDSAPTMVLDRARVTNPVGWSTPAAPPEKWRQPQEQVFYPYTLQSGPNQTLGIVSLATGAASLTIGWCCSSGLLLGPAAIITGFIALSQNKKDPEHYGGRPLAIAGIVAGAIYLAIYVVIMILYLAAAILPNLRPLYGL